jgi:hypothetical protein
MRRPTLIASTAAGVLGLVTFILVVRDWPAQSVEQRRPKPAVEAIAPEQGHRELPAKPLAVRAAAPLPTSTAVGDTGADRRSIAQKRLDQEMREVERQSAIETDPQTRRKLAAYRDAITQISTSLR